MEEIVSDETYKYWYGSLKGAINLLYYNSRNSAKTRLERGRVSAGIHDIKTDDILEIWDKQDGKCAYSGIPLNYDINEWRLSINRIDENMGYTKDNINLVPIELNSRAGWNDDKISDMLRILDMNIIENNISFDLVTTRKVYGKQEKVIIDGCKHFNCTLCGKIKKEEAFGKKPINGCKECISERMSKARDTPRGMMQILLQTAKNSTNFRKSKKNSYKRDHTFDIDFDFLVELYKKQKGLCAYSGLPLQFGSYKEKNWTISLERKNPLKGYTKDNVCLICKEFNSADQTAKLSKPTYGSAGWSREKFLLFLAFVKHKHGLIPDEELPKIVANSAKRYTVKNYGKKSKTIRPVRDFHTKYRNNKYGEVWKLTSPGGKSYIYSTDVLNQERSQVFNIIKKYRNKAINVEIKEHGQDKILAEVILTCPKDKHKEFRKLMIREYNTIEPNGLNPKPSKLHTEDTTDGIADTLKKKAQKLRKGHDGRDLPLYMKFTDTNDRTGYEIKGHPLHENRKYFVNKKKTLDQLYEEALAFLNQLNAKLDANKASTSSVPVEEETKEPPASALPKGVYYFGAGKKKIKAQIQYNKEVRVLGTFDVSQAEEAHQLYLKFKNAIDLEKKGGPKVDFGDIKGVKRKK